MNGPLPSRFLPADFDARRPVAVVAGQRDYPWLVVQAMRAAGVPVRLIELAGETDPALVDTFPERERATIKVGQIGKMLKALQQLQAGYCLFVGQVTPGRLFKDLSPDLKAITLLATLKERNAETIFGALAREVQKIGVTMLDARAFMDGQLARPGVMTGGSLQAKAGYIEHGIRIAKEMARLDVGQGVVVRKGTVLAVEAFEGTDDMLARANKYKTEGLIFVKTSKPGQNPYFDWPVFGHRTLESMRTAGIQTAALEVDRVVILQQEAVLRQAREWGIELYGYTGA
ncbi:MAG: UDP-2,3-diacylglucosamine diphosphatase LpxI [Verrucomicrobiota bacterium JB022]|nr:UDP-2,3-diacylglucosamine diphosphatase LpxI [Verrucomicrobiota bacterium JB022]